MAEQFCLYNLKELELLAEFHPNTLFSLSVLHFIFSPVATLGNILVIRALSKASSIPSNVKKLFLSLAISDLAVGLFGQLMLAVIFRMAANKNYDLTQLCSTTLTVCYLSLFLLTYSSFLTVTAIAVDRLFAISLHLRYAELVTPNRIITAIVSMWVASAGGDLLHVYLHKNSSIIFILAESVGFVVTTVAYVQIYRVARHHQKIHGQLQLHSAQAMDFIRENKSALNVLYFYLVFIACYLPHFLVAIFYMTVSTQSFGLQFWAAAFYVTSFLVLLNSSLNLLLYCWRYREIRQIIRNMVRINS